MKTNECPQCGAPVESSATRCGYCKVDFSIHHNEKGKVAPITSKDINAAIDAEEKMEKERIRRREVEEKKAAEVEKERRIKAEEIEKERKIRKEVEKDKEEKQKKLGQIAIILVVATVFIKLSNDISWWKSAAAGTAFGLFLLPFFYFSFGWRKKKKIKEKIKFLLYTILLTLTTLILIAIIIVIFNL